MHRDQRAKQSIQNKYKSKRCKHRSIRLPNRLGERQTGGLFTPQQFNLNNFLELVNASRLFFVLFTLTPGHPVRGKRVTEEQTQQFVACGILSCENRNALTIGVSQFLLAVLNLMLKGAFIH